MNKFAKDRDGSFSRLLISSKSDRIIFLQSTYEINSYKEAIKIKKIKELHIQTLVSVVTMGWYVSLYTVFWLGSDADVQIANHSEGNTETKKNKNKGEKTPNQTKSKQLEKVLNL